MSYFVTGATGFIGRNLVEQLLEREGTIYVLVREGSRGRLEELRSRWGAGEDRIVPVIGRIAGQGSAYSYLVSSTQDYPEPTRIAAIMREVGLVDGELPAILDAESAMPTGVLVTDPLTLRRGDAKAAIGAAPLMR